jgi:hypothetical protein
MRVEEHPKISFTHPFHERWKVVVYSLDIGEIVVQYPSFIFL